VFSIGETDASPASSLSAAHPGRSPRRDGGSSCVPPGASSSRLARSTKEELPGMGRGRPRPDRGASIDPAPAQPACRHSWARGAGSARFRATVRGPALRLRVEPLEIIGPKGNRPHISERLEAPGDGSACVTLDRSYVARGGATCPLSREFEFMNRIVFWLHESGLRHFLGAFGGIGNRIPPQNRVRKQLFLATPWTHLSSVSAGRWSFSAVMAHVTSV
jgi:hypothetical protein